MATLACSRDSEQLPDSLSCKQTVTRNAKYIGSFSVSVDVVTRKSSILDNLSVLRAGYNHGRDILLDISLTGITVTGSPHQAIIMTHPLKTISYATCHPASCLFSFMARHPTSPLHLQQCHTFRLPTPCQAEEVNTIVGTSFRAAYALQMQREGQEVRRIGDPRMKTSRSAENLLSSSNQTSDRISHRLLTSTTSATSLVQTDEDSRQSVCVTGRINCMDRRQTVSPVTLPEYSQVFDMEDQRNMDSKAQDSGISSTSDSTNSYSSRYKKLSLNKEDNEDLSTAPWYQAAMKRDIAMSVLAKEPLGSFMVRNSETQPGTLALSVGVQDTFHTCGITHYIINMLENGYQIKGFLKVHPSLTALITHHSIMPELLPVPLNIHRHNQSFSDMDHDYPSLKDYTQLMRDIKLGEEGVLSV